jgi:hypothetical protein
MGSLILPSKGIRLVLALATPEPHRAGSAPFEERLSEQLGLGSFPVVEFDGMALVQLVGIAGLDRCVFSVPLIGRLVWWGLRIIKDLFESTPLAVHLVACHPCSFVVMIRMPFDTNPRCI